MSKLSRPDLSPLGRGLRSRRALLLLSTLVVVAGALAVLVSGATFAADGSATPVMPRYDADSRLLVPEGFTRWILAGSSLGLSYSEGETGHEMYHFTLIEPTAYEHFRATGEFREGTMLALLLHDIGSGATPARHGRYAARAMALEMAVKDSARNEGAWAYYNFTGAAGLAASARAMPQRSCQACHDEHAAHDNVFLQFYPLLVDAAPAGVLPASLGGAFRLASQSAAPVAAPPAQSPAPMQSTSGAAEPLRALGGLDPVHLVEGRSELGKPEIVATHEGFRYQFVSEPSRAQFAADPERYSIQNETCPVVDGAAIDPALFAVHEKKIYAFATADCVEQFEASPASYLDSE